MLTDERNELLLRPCNDNFRRNAVLNTLFALPSNENYRSVLEIAFSNG